MTARQKTLICKALGLAVLALFMVGNVAERACAMAAGPERTEFAQAATWNPPTIDAVKTAALAWLAERGAEPAVREKAEAIWSADGAEGARVDLLDRLAATFALVDADVQQLVETCAAARSSPILPDFGWLVDDKRPQFLRYNLRLVYGRWLAQEALYDECLEQIADLKPEDVADPASLLFYQSVANHRLLNKDAALEAIGRLLERSREIPRRYESLAQLMQADMTPLADDTLDHIARRMDDIRRRLELGRAGPKVREVEDGVIASLDKLIEKIEEQEQAAAAAMAARQPQQGPSNPARESMPIEMKGPGNIAKKDIGHKSGWGNLPQKDREKAMQQIGQEFPSHYRDIIEQYFRKLATESEEK